MGLGDPDELDALARRLDELAVRTDEAGTRLVTAVNVLHWESLAADAFRLRAAEHAGRIRGDAYALRLAAIQVRRLAGDVRHGLASLRHAENAIGDWFHDIGDAIGGRS